MRQTVVLAILIGCVHAYPMMNPLNNPYANIFNPYGAYGGLPGYGGFGQLPPSSPFGFGYGYGNYGGYYNPYSGMGNAPAEQQQQQVVQQPAVRQNYMWLCLEDIFPESLSTQAGLNAKQAELLSNYITHAYVLLGPSVDEAVAWQMTLDEGQQFWAKFLVEAKSLDTEHPTQWGEQKAATVQGRAKISTAGGRFVFSHSERCFRTKQPVKCSSNDVQSFSNSYLQTHDRFNLLSNNCVMYSCNLLKHCVADANLCDTSSCTHELMYNSMQAKNPSCDTQVVDTPVANQMMASPFTIPYGMNEQQSLEEFMPMHAPKATEQIHALVASAANAATAATA
eukprot:c3820_g1_i1.p1 GENE.c3820_g1_i1~~c3820_g1_i1.p1  ORF type:complete len:338 (-),score=70.07 c3820_g1_i1:16-1029(-)